MKPAASATADALPTEHALETAWTIWFDKKSKEAFDLLHLGSFHTVEGFWCHYCHLARPSQLEPGDNYHVFRGAVQPAWEAIPSGGCWLLRRKRPELRAEEEDGEVNPDASELNMLWERLLLTVVGEALGTSAVVGAGLSVRSTSVALTLWTRDSGDDEGNRQAGRRLHELLGLPSSTQLEWRSSPNATPTLRKTQQHQLAAAANEENIIAS